MSELVLSFGPKAVPKRAGGVASWLARATAKLRERSAQRRAFDQLGQLDDRALKDIGLYRIDLVASGSRPFNLLDI